MAGGFENVWEIELFKRKKNGEPETKRALDYLRTTRNLHNSCHRYERRAVLQNVLAIILL